MSSAMQRTRMDTGMDQSIGTRLPRAFHHRLDDDTGLLLRWVDANDGALFRRGFRALSEYSRRLRFFSESYVLSDRQVRYFTDIDHVNHMAWGALAQEQEEEPGVGVARYIRNSERPAEAEVALTVVDRFQGKGIGTLLYAALNYSAAENGIRFFTFYVLFENSAFIRRLKGYGGRVTSQDGGVVQIQLPVHGRADDVPVSNRSGRTLQAAMRTVSDADSAAPGIA